MKTKRTLFSIVVFLSVFGFSIFMVIKNPVSHRKEKADSEDILTSEIDSHEEGLTSAIRSFSYSDSDNFTKDRKLFLYEDNISNTETDLNNEMEAVGSNSNGLAQKNSATDTEETQSKKVSSKYSDIGISVADNFVNIRKKANTESEILGKLYRNSAAKILKKADDWYYVESGSVKGYVKSEYIKTGIPEKELTEKYGELHILVNVDGLNVREKAEIDSEKLTVIYKDEKYSVVKIKNDWVKINVPDDKVIGYVKKEHVDLITDFKKAVSKEEEQKLLQLKEEKRINKETEVKYREDVNYTKDELKLLTCLVQAEAGNQSYEGKLAVANVVLNRVKSNEYPDTIKAVIYQPGQFSVADSGSLSKQLANYDHFSSNSQLLTIKAAKAALNGANNIGDRLYFHSYKSAVRKGYDHKSTSIRLDGHLFW